MLFEFVDCMQKEVRIDFFIDKLFNERLCFIVIVVICFQSVCYGEEVFWKGFEDGVKVFEGLGFFVVMYVGFLLYFSGQFGVRLLISVVDRSFSVGEEFMFVKEMFEEERNMVLSLFIFEFELDMCVGGSICDRIVVLFVVVGVLRLNVILGREQLRIIVIKGFNQIVEVDEMYGRVKVGLFVELSEKVGDIES